jgi:hypothetical protein
MMRGQNMMQQKLLWEGQKHSAISIHRIYKKHSIREFATTTQAEVSNKVRNTEKFF